MQVVDWQLVVKKHAPAVWRTAYRILGNTADAADCFQETFLCALKFSQRRRVRNFSALLTRLATVRAIDKLRQRYRESHINANKSDLAAVASANPGPAQQAQTSELIAELREALGQLPQQQAQVFCLRYLNDFSYRQIAKALSIKTATAGVLLHRARAKLQALLDSTAAKEQR